MARLDPHSTADDAQPRVAHLAWRARVDFDTQTVSAEATLALRAPAAEAGPLDLDTRDLAIESVVDEGGATLPFALDAPDPILGRRLRVELPAGARAVRIGYRTAPDASALQWLAPAQTAGGRQPFLYTQCQPIHARSVVPLQDTPRHRIRFEAEISVPRALRAAMAAEPLSREEQGDEAVERFRLPQPIPPYLFAFAVGDLAARELGPRSRVWAEPSVVERAAWEFAETDAMLAAGEALFGPYDWERFDLLVLPPSFPYGGMENPRLTFLTPTVLAGDRSLVDVVAHELAHAWTGNLVTNATAEHFWLNEGFTTWAERRIVEVLYGPEQAALRRALGIRSLEQALETFADRPALTRLRLELEGVDPDEAYSTIPYEKGALFLAALEQHVGRARFDAFVRRYIQQFRFGTLATEAFAAFVEAQLPGALAAVDADAWLYQPGLPADAPRPRSARLEAIERLGATLPSDALAEDWSATEWQIYLESLPRPLPLETCAALDQRFRLTARANADVLAAWLEVAARAGYRAALPRTEAFLGEVGRMKYLRPLYRALARDPDTRPRALACFERFAPRYHPIARNVVQGILRQAPASSRQGAHVDPAA